MRLNLSINLFLSMYTYRSREASGSTRRSIRSMTWVMSTGGTCCFGRLLAAMCDGCILGQASLQGADIQRCCSGW
jgi:hypothetical protein